MVDAAASGSAPMGFREYLAVLNRRRLVIVFVTLVVVGIGLFVSLSQTSVYKAGGEVLLRVDGQDAATVPTEARILESPAVHQLALAGDPDVGEVSAADDPTVNVISVTAEDEDPERAAKTVNAHMNAYVEYSRQAELDRYLSAVKVIQPLIDDLQRQIDALGPVTLLSPENAVRRSELLSQQLGWRARLQDLQVDSTLAGDSAIVVADAGVPSSPIRPKPERDALIALGAGLLLAIALAFAVELLDDSIRTSDDLQRTIASLPLLAMIPPMRVPRSGLVTVVAPRSTPAEAYRSLRTAVQFIVVERGSCIEIASARAGEGKSITTANLAVALAQAGQPVVVVDADLRAPTMHALLGVSNDVGLTSVVTGEPLTNALQRVPQVPNLTVLTAGPIPANPSEVIASDRFRDLVRNVRKEAAIVLIDTPPILAVTDAMVVAGIVDAVVLIARAGSSTRRQVRHSLQLMRQLGAPVVGAVLNGAPEPRHAYYVRATRRRRSRGFGRGDQPAPAGIGPAPESPESPEAPESPESPSDAASGPVAGSAVSRRLRP